MFVPRASSEITMSASLVDPLVSLFSSIFVTTLARATVGASLISFTVRLREMLSSGLPPTPESSTFTVTSSWSRVSKSNPTPALRCSSDPTMENEAACAPDSVRSLLPRASSEITISASLVDPLVLLFSSIFVTTLASATVGASLMSFTVRLRATLSSGLPPTAASSTATVTSSWPRLSASSTTPAFRNSSLPTMLKDAAWAPDSDRLLLPRASSEMTMSASLVAPLVLLFSSIFVTTLASATVGASLISFTVRLRATLSSGLPPTPASSTSTVTSS